MSPWSATLALSVCMTAALQAAGQAPEPARQGELRHMLQQDCGSCHGLTFKGGLGPPLLASSLSGKPAEFLVQTILDGRPGTAMPPWRPLISETDARWMVEQLQSGEATK